MMLTPGHPTCPVTTEKRDAWDCSACSEKGKHNKLPQWNQQPRTLLHRPACLVYQDPEQAEAMCPWAGIPFHCNQLVILFRYDGYSHVSLYVNNPLSSEPESNFRPGMTKNLPHALSPGGSTVHVMIPIKPPPPGRLPCGL